MSNAKTSEANVDEFYDELSTSFAVSTEAKFERLVVPNSNSSEPFHRWFHMKEAYSANFLPSIVEDLALDDCEQLRILDPFAGSGTTAVSAGQLDPIPSVYGTECNPFLQLLASCKQRAMRQSVAGLQDAARNVVQSAELRLAKSERFKRPALSTFRNSDYFNPQELRRLLAVVDEIGSLPADGETTLVVDLLRLAAACTVEPVSKLRRDGRALRYWPSKPGVQATDEFLRRVAIMESDAEGQQHGPEGDQLLGDARCLTAYFEPDANFDLAVFSPPYPNNIDYTEVYKLESWLLGYINNREEFRDQRNRTLHSHPSLRRPTDKAEAQHVAELVDPIAEAVPTGRYRNPLLEMVTGYLIDMSRVLSGVEALLKPGGQVAFAVGNSCHGAGEDSVVIAADVLLMAAGRQVGLVPEKIAIARRLTRKSHSSEYLRESVCFLRKEGDG